MTEFQKFSKDYNISSQTLHDYSSSMSNLHLPTNLTPNIIEERQMNAVVMDVFSRLMMDRIIFMGQGVDDTVANIINAQMLFLESVDPKKDIYLYINSPGGSVYDGLAIYDVMQYVQPDIHTVCTGLAASMGAVLLTAGAPGKRSALRHSRIMIHQPLGGARGQATEIAITFQEISKLKIELYEILAEHSGQPYQKIWDDCERDNWMKAEEAKTYGLIDEILLKK